MGPKARKKDTMGSEALRKEETIVEVAENVTEVVDPYFELRYTPQQPPIKSLRPAPRVKKMLVLKKKKLPPLTSVATAPAYQPIKETVIASKQRISLKSDLSMYDPASKHALKCKDEVNPNMLNIAAVNSGPLSKWFAPAELPRTPKPLEVLKRNLQESSAYSRMIECSFRKEFSLLRRFEEAKLKELQMENHIMKSIGKTRQGLLLRKKQFLPHIDHIGEEKTHGQFERTETPEIIYDTDIFSEAARQNVDKNGIRRTLTRRERGYNVVTDWIGCPEVTDFIAEMLGKPTGAHYNIDHSSDENETMEEGAHFVPKFEELAVIGLTYEKVQQQLKDIEAAKVKNEVPKSPYMTETPKTGHGFKMDSEHRNVLGTESDVSYGESIAGLAIGQIELFWTRDPDRSKKRWIVELGCTAEVGTDSVGSITIKNIGTTALHFRWEKLPASNTFQLKKYNLTRFVFDCWGGVILPGETFRVPVLYKCIEPSFYSEDWQLLTQPVLENGAVIITRLWGITCQYDPYRRIREEIDADLTKRIGKTLVEHGLQNFLGALPVKEVPLKDTRFPLIHLGPDLFHLNNPTLKYHFASVYRLGKLAPMTEHKRPRISTFHSEKSAMSAVFSEIDETASEFLIASKAAPSEFSNDLVLNEKSLVSGEEEEDGTLIKSGMYSDDLSVYSDEMATTSILYIKRLIEEQISPDIPVTAIPLQEPAEDEIDYEETSMKSKRPLAINLVNPDFSVDTIRQNILDNWVDPQEHREAQFLILSEQVTRLLFSTDKPMDTWKSVVARSLFCNAMEIFSDFAASLKAKCCEGQLLQAPKENSSTAYADSSSSSVEEDDMGSTIEEHSSETSNSLSEVKSEETLSCSQAHPRRGLQQLRYQDQYYNRLYSRMYSLLSDYVDSFYDLLTEAQTLNIVQEDIGFTRVRDIPMSFKLEDLLNAPLPPGWVMLAQKMDNVVYKNQARKKALTDGLSC